MTVVLKCNCGQHVQVEDTQRVQSSRCPACGAEVSVPPDASGFSGTGDTSEQGDDEAVAGGDEAAGGQQGEAFSETESRVTPAELTFSSPGSEAGQTADTIADQPVLYPVGPTAGVGPDAGSSPRGSSPQEQPILRPPPEPTFNLAKFLGQLIVFAITSLLFLTTASLLFLSAVVPWRTDVRLRPELLLQTPFVGMERAVMESHVDRDLGRRSSAFSRRNWPRSLGSSPPVDVPLSEHIATLSVDEAEDTFLGDEWIWVIPGVTMLLVANGLCVPWPKFRQWWFLVVFFGAGVSWFIGLRELRPATFEAPGYGAMFRSSELLNDCIEGALIEPLCAGAVLMALAMLPLFMIVLINLRSWVAFFAIVLATPLSFFLGFLIATGY